MKINEFFNPENIEHLKAYRHLQDNGFWPEGFIPAGTEFCGGWHSLLAFEMANKWVNYKLGKCFAETS